MTMRDKIFYTVCILLIGLTITFFLNLWYKFIPYSYVDKYVILIFFTIIGLSLLPFADKLKIGNLFEIERLKEKIEDIQLHQYLGEIIRTPNGDILYYDNDGTHRLPDNETEEFLRTNKGEVLVTKDILHQMKSSYILDSVKTSKKVIWGGKHVFVILNNKKYWVSPTDLVKLGIPNSEGLTQVTDEEIRLIPTGK